MIRAKEIAWWLCWDRWVFVLFVVGAWFLSGSNQLKVLGLVLSATFIIRYISSSQRWRLADCPHEVVSYSMWGLWVGMTGVFVCLSLDVFWMNYRTLVQTAIMIWVIYGLLRIRMNDDLVYNIIILCTVCHIIVARLGYNLDLTSGEVVNSAGALDEMRVAGLVGNANAFGFLMIYGVECAMLVWKTKRSPFNVFWKAFLLVFMLFAVYTTFSTGSRKSTAAIVLLMIGWMVWLLPIGKGGSKWVTRFGMAALIIALSASAFTFILNDTVVGARFTALSERGKGSVVVGVEDDIRTEMYHEGLNMWREHPIAGVGLGHFNAYFWKGLYSHSDYIEPLACTGLVGFLLYHSFNFFLCRRLFRLYPRLKDSGEKYRVGTIIMALIVHLLLGLGAPYWSSQRTYIIQTVFVTYAWMLEKKYRFLINAPSHLPVKVGAPRMGQ